MKRKKYKAELIITVADTDDEEMLHLAALLVEQKINHMKFEFAKLTFNHKVMVRMHLAA